MHGKAVARHSHEELEQGHGTQGLLRLGAGEDVLASHFPWQSRKDLYGAIGKRHAMLPAPLHALGRHSPYASVKIDLGPLRSDDLTSSTGGQDAELERPRRHAIALA